MKEGTKKKGRRSAPGKNLVRPFALVAVWASLDKRRGCTTFVLSTKGRAGTPYLGLDKDGNVLCVTLDFGFLE